MAFVCDVHKEYLTQMGYNDLEHWMSDPNNVYVARRGVILLNKKRFPNENSMWANPYKVDKDGTLTEVLYKYWYHLYNMISKDPSKMIELQKLKGKRLGCWCVKRPFVDGKSLETWCCHGQILCYFINYYYP